MTNTKRPPEASRAGKNRYYHTCDAVGSSRHYGVCLFTIEAFERGQTLNETPCVKAMNDGTCPAMKMRQEERDAGEALYFKEHDPAKAVDRKAAQRERESVNRNHPSYQRGRHGVVWGSEESKAKASEKPSIKKATPRKPEPDVLEFDASAIVNAVLESERTLEDVKQAMLEVGRPAAERRKQDIRAGRTPKPSVFDYMSADEKRQLYRLKREKDELTKQEAA